MRRAIFIGGISIFLVLIFFNFSLIAQKDLRPYVDKKLCAKMIRKGKEAYMRGRYLEAKGFFRKAIQADPTSKEAWIGYDLSVIYALAQKVEKNTGYLTPESPKVEEEGPPTPHPKQKEEEEFVIEEDEGC